MFEKIILKPFLESANKHTSCNALCINDHFHTYGDLTQQISAIRKVIRNEKIEGRNIGLADNNDIETYASIFAIWLEGGAYVPIHPNHPKARSQEIINQTGISLLLDSENKLTFPSVKTIESKNIEFPGPDLDPCSVPDHVNSIVIFTSGSTGKQKGVVITRANLAAFINIFWHVDYQIDHRDRFLQLADLSFDISIMLYLIPFIRGACVYTLPRNHLRYVYIAEVINKYKLTVCVMIPSIISYIRFYFKDTVFPSLRYVLSGGEALTSNLAEEWIRCIPNAVFDNIYGPCESAVYCSFYRYKPKSQNKAYNGIVSVGKPLKDNVMIIVDDNNRELPQGEKGEVSLCSPQLTPGYIDQSELNHASFFIDDQGHRFYKTGDICFQDKEGDFMFCERKDAQVKIQGLRVELHEIEYHVRKIIPDQDCAAIAFNNQTRGTEIALFIEGTVPDKKVILHQLAQVLPNHMIPAKISCVPKFPTNVHGKTDRIKFIELIQKQNT